MEETRTIRALCPKCTSSVPKLTLVGNSLYIKCDCGKNENAPLPLSEYLSQLKSQPDRKVSFKTTCAKKKKKKYQFCCIECSSSLCEQCQSEHKCKENLQNAIFPMELIQYTYLNNLPRNIKNAEGIISSYFPTLKEQYLKEEKVEPERMIYHHVTVYEEVGHGGAASIPDGVTEVISVDMGCVGDGLSCDETQVSICAKDSRGPYNYDVVTGLIKAAKENDIDFAVDVYPYYGSDADVALTAGYDIRHGLIGSGVYASHGYERSHKDGVKNTFKLICAYLG